ISSRRSKAEVYVPVLPRRILSSQQKHPPLSAPSFWGLFFYKNEGLAERICKTRPFHGVGEFVLDAQSPPCQNQLFLLYCYLFLLRKYRGYEFPPLSHRI